jgi:hypothetical protein
MIDVITAWRKVNAANKNKRVLFESLARRRMNLSNAALRMKECFRPQSAEIPLRRNLRQPVHLALDELLVGAVAA